MAAAPDMLTAIGLMSGTSMDGIDAALIRTDGAARIETGPGLTMPYPEAFRARLRAALGRPEAPADLTRDLTDLHAAAVRALLADMEMRAHDVDLVGFHGHSILHAPHRGVTVQIGDGARLAKDLGIAVVNDLRAADVRAGGQGAPLVPVFHAALAAGLEKPLALVNIGGVANVTWIGGAFDLADPAPDARAILAFDTGPGNALLDDWVRRHTGQAWDRDGALALAGRADAAAAAAILADPYFARPGPKSLDRNAFSVAPAEALAPADGAATLVRVTALAIARAASLFPAPPRRWLICGGGRRNPGIMRELRAAIAAPIDPVDSLGWDGDMLEAHAFGYLAVRSLRGLPLSFPTTTGVRAPMPGGVRHAA